MLDADEKWMREALCVAHAALDADEVPVGRVIVHGGRLVGRAHNQLETLRDPTAHAEMIALTAAAEYIGHWRCEDCTMYVTLEPCAMCAGALVLARMRRLVYGATDEKAGACGSLFTISEDPRLNHRVKTVAGVMAESCADLLREFFRRRRALGRE